MQTDTVTRAILVPIDGSANSLRALDFAIKEATRQASILHVLNVQPLMDEYGMVPAYLSKQKYRNFAAQRAAAVLAPAIRRLHRAEVQHTTHVAYGDVAAMIARTASRLRCASIVMGTRGMSALGDLVLGSVATKVIHLTKKPVVLIK